MNNNQDKFYPSSLKKRRISNARADIQKLYTLMLKLQLDFDKNFFDIKIQEFRQIWIESQIIYIHWCKIEDEEPEQFYQSFYEILIKNYFYESDCGKVFCIYSLYFLYFGSEDKIKIAIDCDFMDSLNTFLQNPKIKENIDFLFVVKKLFTAFHFCTKVGLKTILLKGNGQPLKRGNIHQVQVQSYPSINKFLDLTELKQISYKYQKLKKKNKKLEKEDLRNLNYTDKLAIQRIDDLLRNLKKQTE